MQKPMWSFSTPPLDKVYYQALRELRKRLECTDKEVVQLGVAALVELLNTGQVDVLQALLAGMRETAPGEMKALL